MNEIIERMAEAISNQRQKMRYSGKICTVWSQPEMAESYREEQRLIAKAAAEVLLTAWNPGGSTAYQVVPMPATPEMIAAAERIDAEMRAQGFANAEPEAIYYAMLDAAPRDVS